MEHLNFTPELFRKFKGEYKKAQDEGKEMFIFKEHEILTAYAKYLIQYLETKFKTK